MRPASRRTSAPVLVLAAVALAFGLAGCSGDSADGGGDDSASSAEAPAAAQRDAVTADGGAAFSGMDEDMGGVPAETEQASKLLDEQRAVIRKGNVALRADDVGKAQFEVQQVVDEYGGRVTAEETTTDDDGNPAYTRMLLRIPSRSFDAAMTELKAVPGSELDTANTSEDDVTTKLIDTRTRIEAQRRSIARITVLFDQAQSIRDIMAIESELSQRQADLDSLERTAAYLAAQTSMSTIVVSIDQIPEKAAAESEESEAGFVTGFKAGWDGLTAVAVGLATALGAVLPWLVALAVVGPPTYLLARAIRRRFSKPGRTPSAA
jgi:Domain of unknown function (DUF4349)